MPATSTLRGGPSEPARRCNAERSPTTSPASRGRRPARQRGQDGSRRTTNHFPFPRDLDRTWSGRYGWGKTRGEEASRLLVAALLRGARRSCETIGVATRYTEARAWIDRSGLTVWSTGNDSGPTSVITRLPGTPSPQSGVSVRIPGPSVVARPDRRARDLFFVAARADRSKGSCGTLRFPPRFPGQPPGSSLAVLAHAGTLSCSRPSSPA